MHYGQIKALDVANGPGVRVSLFVSGCTNRCPHCFQPQTWDFSYGTPFTDETIAQIITLLSPAHVEGLTLLGGEPMEPSNQEGLLPLVQAVRRRFPNKSIWCFTGFLYEDLLDVTKSAHTPWTQALLDHLDVLVDGRFVQELKDVTLRFRGSRNQRLLDVPQSLAKGEAVLWQGSGGRQV